LLLSGIPESGRTASIVFYPFSSIAELLRAGSDPAFLPEIYRTASTAHCQLSAVNWSLSTFFRLNGRSGTPQWVGWAGRTLSGLLLPGFAIARFFPEPEKPAHPPGVQRSTWLCPANAGALAQGKESPQKTPELCFLTET
jgi:hypothetical protein